MYVSNIQSTNIHSDCLHEIKQTFLFCNELCIPTNYTKYIIMTNLSLEKNFSQWIRDGNASLKT